MDHHRFRDHSIWIWVGLAALLILLICGVVGAKPLWEFSKQRRAESFLRKFQEADTAGREEAASAALRSAFFMAPDHPPVARAVAYFYSRGGLPESLNLWRELEAVSPLTLEDKLAYARVAAELDRYDIAIPLVGKLVAESPSAPGVLTLAAEIAQRRGDIDTALTLANEALDRDPTNDTNQWRLANMQLRHPNPSIQAGGMQRLMALASGGGAERVRAGSFLLASRQLQPGQVNLLLRLFPERTGAPLDERLIRLGLANLNDPGGRLERLRKFAEPYWNPEGRSNLLYVVNWLGQMGAYDDILEVVPEKQALTDSRLYLNRAGALGELDRWKEVESLFTSPSAPNLPLQQLIFRAAGAHAAGRTNESLGYWKQAVALAGSDHGILQSIARLSEYRGYAEVALEAWRALLGDPRVAPRAASEVLRLAAPSRNLTATRDALRRLDQLGALPAPGQVSLALYEALLNPDPTRARNVLARAANSGETNQIAVANALIALRANEPEMAAQEMDALHLEWERAPLLWQVVRVAQLGRAGRRTEARDFASRLDVVALSAAERKLIELWLPTP